MGRLRPVLDRRPDRPVVPGVVRPPSSYAGGGPAADGRIALEARGSLADTTSPALDEPSSVTIYKQGGKTYALVTLSSENGVQIIDITDPDSITAMGKIGDCDDGNVTDATCDLVLDGPWDAAVYRQGSKVYAAVPAFDDDGLQILDITDPSSIVAKGSIAAAGVSSYDGARAVAVYEQGGNIFAVITASQGDNVSILQITDPDDIILASDLSSLTTSGAVDGASSVAVYEQGSKAYAAVTSTQDNALQIIDITDPAYPSIKGNITDTGSTALANPRSVAVYEYQGRGGAKAYAAVASFNDDGVQMLDITDPDRIAAAGYITDGGSRELQGASAVSSVFSFGGLYAAVASITDSGVQIIDITDPDLVMAAAQATNSDAGYELGGAFDIAVYRQGVHTYAAVASFNDDALQIIRIGIPAPDLAPAPDLYAGPARGIVSHGASLVNYGSTGDADWSLHADHFWGGSDQIKSGTLRVPAPGSTWTTSATSPRTPRARPSAPTRCSSGRPPTGGRPSPTSTYTYWPPPRWSPSRPSPSGRARRPPTRRPPTAPSRSGIYLPTCPSAWYPSTRRA